MTKPALPRTALNRLRGGRVSVPCPPRNPDHGNENLGAGRLDSLPHSVRDLRDRPPAGAFIAGCGGDDSGDSSEDPQTVLDDTFNNEATISSGNLNLTAGVSAEGEQGGSFDASLSGPFQGDPDSPTSIPQLDWTVSASGSGGGQEIDFEGGLVVTEDNAFVEYNGETYEVGADTFGQVKDQLEAQAGAAEGGDASASFAEGCKQALEQAGVTDTSGCDIDLSTWLTNLTNEGTEDVGGVRVDPHPRRCERRADPHRHRRHRRCGAGRGRLGLRSLAAEPVL